MTTTHPTAMPDPAPSTTTPALRVDHLSHTYAPRRRRRRSSIPVHPDRPALDDVSFTIEPGEIFGILGPNGGGKTTLFRILSTSLEPRSNQAGSAEVFGYDVLRQPDAVRALLGVVFQHPSLDAKLTAHENLLHQGHLYGLRGRDLQERINQWLTRFGLADRAHDATEQFSGGMRRRVELAKALLHQPRLLLMDEPATGLDPAARRDVWHHLEQLRAQQGVTVALTTHLMDEADRCDRLAIIAQGKLIAVDRPDRLKASIGGDIITVDPHPDAPDNSPEQLAALIEQRFGPWEPNAAPRVVDGQVRFEKPQGPEIVAAVASAWPGRTRRISVGQPTLEDVFLRLTGSALSAT